MNGLPSNLLDLSEDEEEINSRMYSYFISVFSYIFSILFGTFKVLTTTRWENGWISFGM